jgi:hypothetical protein
MAVNSSVVIGGEDQCRPILQYHNVLSEKVASNVTALPSAAVTRQKAKHP